MATATERTPRLGAEPMTMHGCLAATAARTPDSPYLVDRGKSWSFTSVAAQADLVARRLAHLSLEPGRPVVLWLPNGLLWLACFFGASKIGMPVVTASPRLRAMDLHHMLADSRAAALVFAPVFLGIDFDRMVLSLLRARARGELPDLEHLISIGRSRLDAVRSLRSLAVADRLTPVDDPDASAVVCYTSGTTGRPKGCVHSHRTLVRNGRVAAGITGLKPGERIACPAPFAHVFGFHMGVLQCAISGATVINAEPYAPDSLADVIESEGATILYAVPTMVRELLAVNQRRRRELGLRMTLVAGAPSSPRLRRAVRAISGLASGLTVVYGCTEAPTIAQMPPDAPQQKLLDSVGRPTAGVEIRISPPGLTEELPVGEVGEILTRGYNQMLGYLNDHQGTDRKRRDGWLVTGDLGYVDSEGYLYFVGRADETLLVGGFNAYPREIEAQIEALEGIGEVAVIGVPDERLGEVPMAWIAIDDSDLDEQAIISWLRLNLASYKRPRHVRIVGRLPRVASGKVALVELTQMARRMFPALPWERFGR